MSSTRSGKPTSSPRSSKSCCLNCGESSHFIKQCPFPIKTENIAQNLNKNVDKSVPKRGKGKGRGGSRGRGVNKVTFFVSIDNSSVNSSVNLPVVSALTDSTSPWYLDTGATDHICGNRQCFQNFEALKPFSIHL